MSLSRIFHYQRIHQSELSNLVVNVLLVQKKEPTFSDETDVLADCADEEQFIVIILIIALLSRDNGTTKTISIKIHLTLFRKIALLP